MPKLTIEHPHSLATEEVKQRLDALSARLASKYGIEARWSTPTEATFKRTGASGSIRCDARKVVVAVELSFVLSPMKGEVEARIKQELTKALSAATAS